jgi:hypothetical protein
MWSVLNWNKSGDNQNHIFKDNFHSVYGIQYTYTVPYTESLSQA